MKLEYMKIKDKRKVWSSLELTINKPEQRRQREDHKHNRFSTQKKSPAHAAHFISGAIIALPSYDHWTNKTKTFLIFNEGCTHNTVNFSFPFLSLTAFL